MSEQNQQPEVAAEEQQEAVLQIQRIYVKTFLLKPKSSSYFPARMETKTWLRLKHRSGSSR